MLISLTQILFRRVFSAFTLETSLAPTASMVNSTGWKSRVDPCRQRNVILSLIGQTFMLLHRPFCHWSEYPVSHLLAPPSHNAAWAKNIRLGSFSWRFKLILLNILSDRTQGEWTLAWIRLIKFDCNLPSRCHVTEREDVIVRGRSEMLTHIPSGCRHVKLARWLVHHCSCKTYKQVTRSGK